MMFCVGASARLLGVNLNCFANSMWASKGEPSSMFAVNHFKVQCVGRKKIISVLAMTFVLSV